MTRVKIVVGGTAEDDAADFLDAWKRGEPGERLSEPRVLGLESWEGLVSILSEDRLGVLRYVRAHPDLSISALSRALERQDVGLHADVTALEGMGLLHQVDDGLRASADRVTVEVLL